MNDSEFIDLTDQVLNRIETAVEASGANIDSSLVGGGVLELECEDGGKIVVNRHAVSQELWVAARAGGFHFQWDGKIWRDTRSSRELMAVLSELLSAQAGESVVLR